MTRVRYQTVASKFWTDDKLPTDDRTRLFALYILTCPHRTTEGIFRLPIGYICDDLGWTHGEVDTALDELAKAQFCTYDAGAKILWIRHALRYADIRNDNTRKGIARRIAELPATPLLADFLEMCRSEGIEDLLDTITIETPELFRNSSPTVPQTVRQPTRTLELELEQELEQEHTHETVPEQQHEPEPAQAPARVCVSNQDFDFENEEPGTRPRAPDPTALVELLAANQDPPPDPAKRARWHNTLAAYTAAGPDPPTLAAELADLIAWTGHHDFWSSRITSAKALIDNLAALRKQRHQTNGRKPAGLDLHTLDAELNRAFTQPEPPP